MKCYKMGKQLRPAEVPASDSLQGNVAVVSFDELNSGQLPKEVKILRDIRELHKDSIKCCKVDMHKSFIAGSFYVPLKKMEKGFIPVGFCIREGTIIFIDDRGLVERIMEKFCAITFDEAPPIGKLFCEFLNILIDEDLLYLEEIERMLEHIEEDTLKSDIDGFDSTMMEIRKKAHAFYRYYSQLIEVGGDLVEGQIFKEEAEFSFDLFVGRAERLKSEIQMLREYSVQVRDVYTSQIDIKQNRIMQILTVVTIIFCPPTLIVGWYGMNFTHMPELRWTFGYAGVIALNVVVVFVCMVVCKKKKFF